MSADPSTETSSRDAKDSNHRVAVIAGYLLIFFSVLIAFGVYKYMDDKRDLKDLQFQEFILVALGLGGALSCAIFGAKAMLSGSQTQKDVILKEDRALLEQLIKEGNEKGIDQYVRLSSLSGMTGSFTQLGLTGLPLATIGLTLFFSIVSIFHPEGFLDLAKLTLGAFIGSFVQRNVTNEQALVSPSDKHDAS